VKKFKVTVDGQSYTVEVEELEEKPAQEPAKASPEEPDTRRVEHKEPDKEPAPAARPEEKEQKEVAKPVVEGGVTEKAPMPGSVLEVKVKEGEKVEEGDVLLVLEAMKMENEIIASQGGTVTEVMVKKGDTVNSEDPLVTLT